MKTKLGCPFGIRPQSCLFLSNVLPVALALCFAPPPSVAQDEAISISAAEFQRLTYSAHLYTQLAQKPELDASLQVLVELQPRNPGANPAALAAMLQEATARYRTNASAYIRAYGFRDEILAAYLDALRQTPTCTNFVPANLSLLKALIIHANAPCTNRNDQAYLFHAGNQRLLSAGEATAQREEILDLCTRRGFGNLAFGAAMDSLLWPETGVRLANTPTEILSFNTALSNSPSWQVMLERSRRTGDGSLSLTTSELKDLFVQEMQTMHGIINTNLAVHLEILETQGDLPSYLANPSLIQANTRREDEVKQGQRQCLAGANASVQALSQLVAARRPDTAGTMRTLANACHEIGESMDFLNESKGLLKAAAAGGVLAAGLELAGLLIDFGPTPEEQIMEQIDQVKIMLNELSTNMNYRFDRVDESLAKVLEAVATTASRIDGVGHDVNQARQQLLSVQSDLHSLERALFEYLRDGFRQELVRHINGGLDYERWWGVSMSYDSGSDYCYQNNELEFYSWTAGIQPFSKDSYSSPNSFDLSESRLYTELTSRPLESSLNYINQFCATNFGIPRPSSVQLANPRDWFLAAQSYLQLALEQPTFFRKAGLHVPNVIATGQEIADFCHNLTFSGNGTNLNWGLHNALSGYYSAKLDAFESEVQATEQNYADSQHFPSLEMWRRWGAAAPRVTAAATELLESHRDRPVVPIALIPPGIRARDGIIALAGENSGSHGLALQSGGTVAAWGDNDYGQSTVPVGLSNVVAVAAGVAHSLALLSNKTVVAWGEFGMTPDGAATTPPIATNVLAIAAGKSHNLAVREDGRVVGWGYNYYGQATGTPTTTWYTHSSTGLVTLAGQTITNAVAAGGGWYSSLVLKADGQVVAWGYSPSGETNVPSGLNDVMAIAAGGFHSLALRSNSTVVAWGQNNYGQTNVPPDLTNVVAVAAGVAHSLALRDDGTVVAWGWNQYGQTDVPPGLSNVVAIAAELQNSLALRSDGTLIVWGFNDWFWEGPLPVPLGLTNVIAVEGGDFHVLALRADGTVVSWGYPYQYNYGQTNVPAGLSNVVAIAAGDYHSLALRSNGTVVAWGYNNYGQINVPMNLNGVVAIAAGVEFSAALKTDGSIVTWGRPITKPTDVTNVVAIAAGTYYCEALTADGRVRAWGDNSMQQCNVPAGLSNVVAIAGGSLHSLALRADGTVVAWGRNDGGCSSVPPGLSNVVAVAAGNSVSVALKADGTAIAWGWNGEGQTNAPVEATNITAIGAGYRFSLYVNSISAPDANASAGFPLVRNPIPVRVRDHLWAVNADVLTNLNDGLHAVHTAAEGLSGSKALLEAVLSLALPYTLERDDVLHGFFYGTEPLMDLDAARAELSEEMKAIQSPPFAPVRFLNPVAAGRFACFRDRLQTRLNDLAQSGEPEIPRLVGHTLRLLNLLRDAWTQPTNAPPPTLEIGLQTNTLGLVLYGEPYAHYMLQHGDNLGTPGWTTTVTVLHNEELVVTPVDGLCRFYRGLLPPP